MSSLHPVLQQARTEPTVFAALSRVAETFGDLPWFCVPARAGRDYDPDGREVTYRDAVVAASRLRDVYAEAGYGLGHRVALRLDNRPEHFLHLLALNALGASVVPLNPDALDHEAGYVMAHAGVDLVVTRPRHAQAVRAGLSGTGHFAPVVVTEGDLASVPAPARSAGSGSPDRTTELAVVYTSGTTGNPKGCILDNAFAFTVGCWYADLGGRLTLRPASERIFVPLPVFHVNAGINTPTALLLGANCLVMPDRFHLSTWWSDVSATRATGIHYLGIMPPALMKAPPHPQERSHSVLFGLGAGLDPDLHVRFEERFGIPMVEVWGMTETGRFFADAYEPRQITTRAFGRPTHDFNAMVVDENDREVARGSPGELVVRSPGEDPRAGFFRGYFKETAATEDAWRNGWFHTGDVAVQQDDGMLVFVERRKNIIRRSGENISAAEVENVLIGHPAVARIAVLSVDDEMRDEEVLCCVVPADGVASTREIAGQIVAACQGRIATYKWPGWVVFVDSLPMTSTQKIQKGLIFPKRQDPRQHPGAFDMRDMKTRRPT